MSSSAESLVPADLRRGLRNYWYPIFRSSDLEADKPLGITRVGEPLVLWRDAEGATHLFPDRCGHRAARLSLGDLVDGRLQCRYHGLQYDGSGQCRFVPTELEMDGPCAREIKVTSYPVEEIGGLIWGYIGDVEMFPAPPLEVDPVLTDPSYASLIAEQNWDSNWLLVQDNSGDPTHVPFLHGHFAARLRDAGLTLEPLPGGNPVIYKEAYSDLVTDELVIEQTRPDQVLITRKGATEDHSATFDEVLFTLPCGVKIWVPIPDGGPPVRILEYHLPVDAERTVVYSWAGRPCSSEEERERTLQAYEMMYPYFQLVWDEDNWITGSQGDVAETWRAEHLLPFDVGTTAIRKLILRAYRDQQRRIAESEKQHATAGASRGESKEPVEAVGSTR